MDGRIFVLSTVSLVVGMHLVARFREQEETDASNYKFVGQSRVGNAELNATASALFYERWQNARSKRLLASVLATTGAVGVAWGVVHFVLSIVF